MGKSLRSRRLKVLLLLSVVILLFVGFSNSILLAQESQSGSVTADQVNEIARELWCPLCSGVRLDSCELKACEQMKDMIAIKLEQGEDLESIKAYFYDQYGPQVLGEPPREGFSWLAWILPFVALIGGGFLMWSRMRMMVRPTPQASATHPTGAGNASVSDEEAAKLREELERYG